MVSSSVGLQPYLRAHTYTLWLIRLCDLRLCVSLFTVRTCLKSIKPFFMEDFISTECFGNDDDDDDTTSESDDEDDDTHENDDAASLQEGDGNDDHSTQQHRAIALKSSMPR